MTDRQETDPAVAGTTTNASTADGHLGEHKLTAIHAIGQSLAIGPMFSAGLLTGAFGDLRHAFHEIVTAVVRCAKGQRYVSPHLAGGLANEVHQRSRGDQGVQRGRGQVRGEADQGAADRHQRS